MGGSIKYKSFKASRRCNSEDPIISSEKYFRPFVIYRGGFKVQALLKNVPESSQKGQTYLIVDLV